MDSITHEILIWKHILDDYKYLLTELLKLGYTIQSVQKMGTLEQCLHFYLNTF